MRAVRGAGRPIHEEGLVRREGLLFAEPLRGVVGEVWAGWLFIKLLWLHEALRRQDLGSEAVGTLEAEARRLGATQAYVDTFSFQAPDFYRKLGYHEFGRLEGWPLGHSRYWMTKAL